MDNTLHYFSDTTNGTTGFTKSSGNTLPASWYSSQEMYEFERRAIFSKRWLFISHKSRLSQTGDWIRYSFASYDIIITRDRTGAINSFHNVCRHRAYPVIEKEGAGNNKILACRYHGWSYGLNGKLAKAPGYQELNLDKDQNSLFRCHTKIDRNGFIWINLDAKQTPEISFEDHFDNVDVQNETSHIDFDDYSFGCELKGDLELNWKHGSVGSSLEQIRQDFNTTSTCYFPNALSTISAKFMVIKKDLPQGPNKTIKQTEIYRHKDCSDIEWNDVSSAYSLALNTEKTDRTIPVFFENTIRDAVTEHYKQEKTTGHEIWPSKPVQTGNAADQVDEDEDICAGLACGPQKEILAW
ncbi:Rieske [2Fe-2S] iron-sulfur domain-containing protein [Boeremia exigua]|uniref:Rieske [2Fe-2S] iron-sulfur domain-containing protein n=1 Tax=Boeremia exigua TaxID=749465 RepID=UPI001E8E1173|nr:Rieske [2Fe-2S] iron-sulfur domain-containing protein [Boeremia exigua]KAH6618481.1 Rieske [2Fe-2S] iron-sulfur domain-containing protein [Boeremia exigua]